ncbi:hypothetical protein EJ04DRAFT_517574 [Polyplosphaeria fusca]|uniref:Heterokaryon incompatibility domain-containing protein n=1 Tax=Polyplosphaeria fusca TaxID=682080 RepID=A0A9P4QII5_9PLEO|nr:hypothetical protein EJ04DRAFT_517574 [Polyplosphaeria fusca]
MTSYTREGENTYNGSREPAYNILSYTWGYFQDTSNTQPPLLVRRVDWPIPSIQEAHFTADTFERAIRRVAKGVRHRCEWVWVDIACIQEHQYETKEARRLRGQEIGRQVSIFRRAKDSFSWLSSIKTVDLGDTSGHVVHWNDFVEAFDQAFEITKKRRS